MIGDNTRTFGQHIIVPNNNNNNINPQFFNPSPAASYLISQEQIPQYQIPIAAHIIGAHSGMPIDTSTGLLKMIQVTGQPCVEYWQTEIGTVGVCSADAMDKYTAFIINKINKLKYLPYDPANYMDLFHKLNILCEAKSRQFNMPGLTDDTDDELNNLKELIDTYTYNKNNKISTNLEEIKDNIINKIKSINESLVAIKTFTIDDSIGTFTYYPVGSWKYDVAFMPQNDLLPDATDKHGTMFNSMNWRDWLTIIGNVPSTQPQLKDTIVTQIENSQFNYDTGKSTTTFYETLGGPWAVGQNTRSGALQLGYLESQMRIFLQNTFVCNIYFGCRVIVKVNDQGVFEDEETKALNVKLVIDKSEKKLKEKNAALVSNIQPKNITLQSSIARVRNLRSDTNQSLQNHLDEKYNEIQKKSLIKLINSLKNVDGLFWSHLHKSIMHGGSKPKSKKSKKRHKNKSKSKRRNNRRTYKKKARKTKRRRY